MRNMATCDGLLTAGRNWPAKLQHHLEQDSQDTVQRIRIAQRADVSMAFAPPTNYLPLTTLDESLVALAVLQQVKTITPSSSGSDADEHRAVALNVHLGIGVVPMRRVALPRLLSRFVTYFEQAIPHAVMSQRLVYYCSFSPQLRSVKFTRKCASSLSRHRKLSSTSFRIPGCACVHRFGLWGCKDGFTASHAQINSRLCSPCDLWSILRGQQDCKCFKATSILDSNPSESLRTMARSEL